MPFFVLKYMFKSNRKGEMSALLNKAVKTFFFLMGEKSKAEKGRKIGACLLVRLTTAS